MGGTLSDDHTRAVLEYVEKLVARIYPPSEVIVRSAAGGTALAEMVEHVSGLRASAEAICQMAPIPPDFRLGKYWTAKGLTFASDQLADRGAVERATADIGEVVSDMGASTLRMQQEIAELRSALNELRAAASADLADLRSAFSVVAGAVSLLEVSDATGAVMSRKRNADLILSEEAVEALKRLGIAVNKRKAA